MKRSALRFLFFKEKALYNRILFLYCLADNFISGFLPCSCSLSRTKQNLATLGEEYISLLRSSSPCCVGTHIQKPFTPRWGSGTIYFGIGGFYSCAVVENLIEVLKLAKSNQIL